jgi:hypothetical protein
MKVGDEVIYVDKSDRSPYYTLNKHYRIYKIDPNFIPGCTCGWILNDDKESVYFRDTDNDKDWEYFSLKENRKEKLQKICSAKD